MGKAGDQDVLNDVDLDAIKQRIQRTHSLPIRSLPAQLSRNGRLWLFEQLERAGFERTPSAIRRPLEQQLLERLADGPIAKAVLLTQIKGASKQESTRLLAQLVKAGRVALVRRGRADLVILPEACAAEERVAELRKLKQQLDRMLKATRVGSQPRRLLIADVQRVLDLVPDDGRNPQTSLLERLKSLGAKDPVVFIPELLKGLDFGGEEATKLLLELARARRIELRPESASGLLSPADAALCPIGPGGIPLSYVRLIEGARA
ncbi:MAG: hypothetical protein H6718_29855 [Polyangiaceae bacterium]|nr:hypothetical protein [Polyangiaceae bacterium]